MLEALNEYYLFNLAGGRIKVNVLLTDILAIISLKEGHQDKIMYLKNNANHKIRGYTLQYLIKITGFLQRVNKRDLVAPYAVKFIDEEMIELTFCEEKDKPKWIVLSGKYRNAFLKTLHYYKK
jgi:hypothetical protein